MQAGMVPNGPRTVDGKIVLEAKMLDNSHRTLLVEPTSTAGVRSVICMSNVKSTSCDTKTLLQNLLRSDYENRIYMFNF